MTGATHMIVPAAIHRFGQFDPVTTLALAFYSHFLLDALPHSHLKRSINYALVTAASILLLSKGWQEKDHLLLLAAFLGGLPDVIDKLGLSSSFSKIHNLHYSKVKLPKQFVLIELVISGLLLLYVIV